MSTSQFLANDFGEQIDTLIKRDHKTELSRLCEGYPNEKQTLVIDWGDVYRTDHELAELIEQEPEQMRRTFKKRVPKVAPQQALVDRKEMDEVIRGEQVRVVFSNVGDPKDVTTLIRGDYVGELVTLRGKVSKATDTRPKLLSAALECSGCQTITNFHQPLHTHNTPDFCNSCESSNVSWEPKLSKSEWTYHQLLRVKHEPGEAESDSWIDVHILWDQAGEVSAGESIDVSGKLIDVWPDGVESGTPEFLMVADHVRKHESDFESIDVRAHRERIEDLANGSEGNPYEVLVKSIAPGIYGGETMDRIKLALACQLFGAPRVEKGDGTSFRGDIHQLLVGAPGTGKSSLQDAIAEYSPKVATVSGKNATKAGVTAAAVRDEFGDTEWSIEAGAFVQANKGICIVDELDKVDGDVLSSLHSALERQKLSIAKAGINADLQCETALLGAANPEHERFINDEKTIEQIPVGPAMRTRLDGVFVLRDPVDADSDEQKVRTMLNSIASGDSVDTVGFDASDTIEPPLNREEIQAWVAYARQEHSVTYDMGLLREKIIDYYTDVRDASKDSGAPINIRKVGSILRYTLASARIRLAEQVEEEDIERAIDIVATSLAQIGLTDDGELSMDAGVASTVSQADRRQRIRRAIETTERTAAEIAEETGISETEVKEEVSLLMQKGDVYEPQTGVYQAT